MDDGETITWQEQAETFQIMLESALEYQRGLEEQVSSLEQTVRSFQNEICEMELRRDDTLIQRDQVIIKQEKEIAHIKHILQIQQRLLQSRHEGRI